MNCEEMSLRDWFAGMATGQDIYDQQDKEWHRIFNETGGHSPDSMEPLTTVQARYRHADDMLKEKEKRDNE